MPSGIFASSSRETLAQTSGATFENKRKFAERVCARRKSNAQGEVRSVMDGKRKMRASTNGSYTDYMDDFDDQVYVPQRATTRRRPGVDFSKLTLASLKRYRHIFKLGDVPGGTKEDLIPAIQRHFAQQVVDEADILIAFASTVRRQSLEYNGIPMKKPRNGLKGVGKVVR
ncbi:hypothetical protein WJX75_000632 [Coccomyxa subellipsoidea]|uniref:Histone deacetylase complex subunit SAP30 Sin3 binding domain-containing protein n=1 Tax=Coccomyxa subellipsoidea TaxID=248742 RepID=A0ABR2YM46_9CHLO